MPSCRRCRQAAYTHHKISLLAGMARMGYNGSMTDWEDTMGFGLSVLYTAVLGVVSHYVGQALPRR